MHRMKKPEETGGKRKKERRDRMEHEEMREACELEQTSPLPKNPVPAMAYVPYQQYDARNLYSAEEAFRQGTLFPVLDKPFYGGDGC